MFIASAPDVQLNNLNCSSPNQMSDKHLFGTLSSIYQIIVSLLIRELSIQILRDTLRGGKGGRGEPCKTFIFCF